jgi:hypothetical protein
MTTLPVLGGMRPLTGGPSAQRKTRRRRAEEVTVPANSIALLQTIFADSSPPK